MYSIMLGIWWWTNNPLHLTKKFKQHDAAYVNATKSSGVCMMKDTDYSVRVDLMKHGDKILIKYIYIWRISEKTQTVSIDIDVIFG